MATVLISNLPTITDATSVKGTDDLIINTGEVGSHNTMSLSFDLFKTALFQTPTQIGTDVTVAGTVTAQSFVASGGFVGDLTGDVVGDVTGTVSDLSNKSTDDLVEGPSRNRLYLNTANLALVAAGDINNVSQFPGLSIGEFKDVDTAAQADGFILISRGGTFVCEDSLQFVNNNQLGTILSDYAPLEAPNLVNSLDDGGNIVAKPSMNGSPLVNEASLATYTQGYYAPIKGPNLQDGDNGERPSYAGSPLINQFVLENSYLGNYVEKTDTTGSAGAQAAAAAAAGAQSTADEAKGTADAALPATSVSTFGLTLIDDDDAATARTTLGLGTAAVKAEGDFASAAAGTNGNSAKAAVDAAFAVGADLKIDYEAGDLDDEAKVIGAINATNDKINKLIAALEIS